MSDQHAPEPTDDPAVGGPAPGEGETFVVVTPDGMGVATGTDADERPAELISQPAKVMRIGAMAKQLLDEVRSAPLDEQGRQLLADIHDRSLAELKDSLSPDLGEELDRLSEPFTGEAKPSDAELRIAQAQLVGWLEGLFHGIQTAMVAQQMAAQARLQQQRALPTGHPGQPERPDGTRRPGAPFGAGGGTDAPTGPTGQYL